MIVNCIRCFIIIIFKQILHTPYTFSRCNDSVKHSHIISIIGHRIVHKANLKTNFVY